MAPPFGRNHGKESSSSMVSQKTLTLIASSEKKKKRDSLEDRNVRKALEAFRELSSKLFNELIAKNPGEPGAKLKALWKAMSIMKAKDEVENNEKRVGPLEGIQVGDKFNYRAELVVTGLHQQPHSGIDYVHNINQVLATSIVVTNRYANMFYNGSLVYIGEGGNPADSRINGSSHDQKLERGNLALRNSMEARSPVRVILKVSENFVDDNGNSSNFAFVYDGLYLVTGFARGRGENGRLVFKFTLNRMPNQPPTCVSHGDLGFKGSFASSSSTHKRSKGSSIDQKEKARRNDVSEGKEKFSIPLMATSDCVELPPPFEYVVDVVYSGRLSLVRQPNPKDSRGPFQLAIYKTKTKGWGVRTRSYIPKGSFVCEFVGEFYPDGKDKLRLGIHHYILDIGAGKGYIDTTRYGNVARFINHSCTPNLCINEEGDKSTLPYMMMYAVRNIPAGTELTYNYNFHNGKLHKAERVKCFCSSQECKGYIYI